MKTARLTDLETVDRHQNRQKNFSLKGRLQSLQCALSGLRLMIRSQHNAWLHALASATVIALGYLLQISRNDWCWLVLALVAVWTAEAMNTALELLADVASPEFHPLVEKAKDVAAGAVLLSAIGSVVIGLLVFGPHRVDLL